MEKLERPELFGFVSGLVTVLILAGVLIAVSVPSDSLLRAPNGDLGHKDAPLMGMIVPLLVGRPQPLHRSRNGGGARYLCESL